MLEWIEKAEVEYVINTMSRDSQVTKTASSSAVQQQKTMSSALTSLDTAEALLRVIEVCPLKRARFSRSIT